MPVAARNCRARWCSSLKPTAAAISWLVSDVRRRSSAAVEAALPAVRRRWLPGRCGEALAPGLVAQPDRCGDRGEVELRRQVAAEQRPGVVEPPRPRRGRAAARPAVARGQVDQQPQDVADLVVRSRRGQRRPTGAELVDAVAPVGHRSERAHRHGDVEQTGREGGREHRAVEDEEHLAPAAGVGAVPVRVAREDVDQAARGQRHVVPGVEVVASALEDVRQHVPVVPPQAPGRDAAAVARSMRPAVSTLPSRPPGPGRGASAMSRAETSPWRVSRCTRTSSQDVHALPARAWSEPLPLRSVARVMATPYPAVPR